MLKKLWVGVISVLFATFVVPIARADLVEALNVQPPDFGGITAETERLLIARPDSPYVIAEHLKAGAERGFHMGHHRDVLSGLCVAAGTGKPVSHRLFFEKTRSLAILFDEENAANENLKLQVTKERLLETGETVDKLLPVRAGDPSYRKIVPSGINPLADELDLQKAMLERLRRGITIMTDYVSASDFPSACTVFDELRRMTEEYALYVRRVLAAGAGAIGRCDQLADAGCLKEFFRVTDDQYKWIKEGGP